MKGGISIDVRSGKRFRAGSSFVPSQSLMKGGGIAGEADGLLHARLLSIGRPLWSAWWRGGPGAWWCGGPDSTQAFSREAMIRGIAVLAAVGTIAASPTLVPGGPRLVLCRAIPLLVA